MIQIRNNVFETNSSSTHSITITIVPREEFEKWEAGEVYFNDTYGYSEDEKWLTKEQVMAMVKKNGWLQSGEIDWDDADRANYILGDELGIYTAENYLDNNYYETYVEPYTTESGDEIVVFGTYGHD